MKHYFSRFPTVNYSGSLVKNIFARVVFDDITKSTSENFAFFKIQDDLSLRADVISENFYDTPYYDWLFYMSNGVVDPYHDVFLDSDSFLKYIISKYGSVQESQQKIYCYINNWADNVDDKLTVEQYDNASQVVKKYYTAEIDYLNRITGYKRHQYDWVKSTNKHRILTLNDTEYLFIGSFITQYVSGSSVATGEIVDVNRTDNTITVKNITGTFVTTVGNTIKKYGSNLTYTISSVVNPDTEDNISDEEASYWSAISVYDFEYELNEAKRNTQLLRKSLVSGVEEQFDNLMGE